MGSRMTAISDMENGMRIMNWLEENYKVQSTDLTEEEISEETEEQEEESEEEEVEFLTLYMLSNQLFLELYPF